MSRKWSVVVGCLAAFLGAFLLVAGAGSRFYAYPRLALIPTSAESEVVARTASGADAEYFDISKLSVAEGPLQSTSYIRAHSDESDTASKELGREVAVWTIYGCTDIPSDNCSDNPLPLSGAIDHFAMDRRTGELVEWDGSYRQTDSRDDSVPFDGLIVKFPFDTQKKDYAFWDGTLRETATVSYTGEGKVEGLRVLEFEQVIEPTQVGEIEVPGSVVGSPVASLTGQQMYSVRRTFSVEPTTGVVITRQEELDSFLSVDGERALTLTRATLSYDEKTIKDTAAEYKTLSTLLTIVRTTFPVVGSSVGIILILVALLLMRRRSGQTPVSPRSAQAR